MTMTAQEKAVKRETQFDRRIYQLTQRAIEESLRTIGLIMQAKWGSNEHRNKP